MVLSNAERQKRYKQRLKARATSGVTPEMVIKAAKLSFDAWVRDNGAFEREAPSWERMVDSARKRGNASDLQNWIPSDPDDDYAEFGADAPLMRTVAAVAVAVLRPPAVS